MALWGWYNDYLDKKKGHPRLKEAAWRLALSAVWHYLYSVTLPSSFALKQKSYLLYNFISFLKFYQFPLPSIRFLKSSSNATFVWKMPFVQYLQPLRSACPTKIRECSKRYTVYHLKASKSVIYYLAIRVLEFDLSNHLTP